MSLRVLIGCEFSGVVRRAFRNAGHDAWSCDLLPAEDGDVHHLQCDVLGVIDRGWNLAIFHPPCTYLTCAGNKWFKPEFRVRFPGRAQKREDALRFVAALLAAPIPRIALENPIGVISSRIRKPDQVIQPWQFGFNARKATCLWLKGLPPLTPTQVVPVTIVRTRGGNTMSRWHVNCGHYNRAQRARERSRTFPGIAKAMSEQWNFD